MRFDLIDRIIDCQPEKLTAIKNVTNAEEYLADHFPQFPVLPGVIMLETMVQAARKLLEAILGDDDERVFVVSEVRNLRYGNMVRPGQALQVEVRLKSSDQQKYKFQGRGSVDGKPAVRGSFILEPLIA